MTEESIRKQSVYITEIEPLAHQIYTLCNTYKIPVFMAFSFNEWAKLEEWQKGEYSDIENTDTLKVLQSELENVKKSELGSKQTEEKLSEKILEAAEDDLELEKMNDRFTTLISNVTDKSQITLDDLECKCLLPEFLSISNPDKRFAGFIKVLNGFDTVMRNNVDEEILSDDQNESFIDEVID